jgi:fumarylpyruvate hydrolase
LSGLGKNIAPRFAHRYYQDITVGIDFTARDLQTRFREAGAPWDLSKGFDGSAVIGEFIPLDGETAIAHTAFSLQIDGKTVQQGNTADLIFPVDEIIAYVSQFYTLKIGDLIYTGTPAGVGPVQIGNHLQGFIGDREVLNFHVK